MSQNSSQFLPSLLIDALNSGKRPGQRENRQAAARPHSRQHSSKSRETSLTPGLFSSPTLPVEMAEEDGPPQERSELSVYIERPPSPTDKFDSNKLLNTPSSVENTVTVYGFPAGKRQFVLDLLYTYGSVTNTKKSEKVDGNWVLVTYLTRHSAERALLLDGQLMEDGWVIAVRRGDVMGIMSPKKKPNSSSKMGQSSGVSPGSTLGLQSDSMLVDHPPDNRMDRSPPKPRLGGMASAYRASPKSLVLDDSFFDTPSKPSSSKMEPLLYYSNKVEEVVQTPEMIEVKAKHHVNWRLKVEDESIHMNVDESANVSQSSPIQPPPPTFGNDEVKFNGHQLVVGKGGRFEEPAVAKVGMLTTVADLLFGW